jgi:lysophospholipase L1-like esterase
MKLSFDEIKSISLGAVDFLTEEDGITPFRFTKEQRDIYEEVKNMFWTRSHGASGIVLSFRTDAEKLSITLDVSTARCRSFFSADLLVNGKRLDSLDNMEGVEIEKQYAEQSFPHSSGIHKKVFDLPEGEKEIALHLPWSKRTKICDLDLINATFFTPIKPKRKILFFGDSITAGYDAMHSTERWTAQIAEKLGAEEINKAIGGETYCPYLSKTKDSFLPDLIFVAYGSNSWPKTELEPFRQITLEFYENLEKNYPGIPVFSISPIWRLSHNRPFFIPHFSDIDKTIREVTEQWSNITVIDGFDLVPPSLDYFSDKGLHPNPKGFDLFVNNLWNKIRDQLPFQPE